VSQPSDDKKEETQILLLLLLLLLHERFWNIFSVISRERVGFLGGRAMDG
jgi:hypothetical protein